ncbi:MAG TPA: hypothetical protein VLX28_02355, partial [Thermoanaerobaculia bacterium]|nr:hypothetical protein [Thermoanaerobaculia bacterium]
AKKERRSHKGAEPPIPAVAVRRERIPPLAKLILACLAVVGLFFLLRSLAPLPWSYDEYYHLGLAREMRSGLRITSFRWTPFSILFDRFVDSTPLFHLMLMPLATLPLATAGRIGVLLGQIFLVGSFAWTLWALRVPRPWWFVLALPALGTLFVVCALFGLTHTGGWIAIPLAVLWALSGLAEPAVTGEPDARAVPWQPIAAAAVGWLLGQLVHPEVPANFRLFLVSNFVVPFQSTAAGDAALRSQLGTEMSRPEMSILTEQWPAFIAPAIVLFALVFVPRLRSRATLTAGLAALAFLAAGCLAARRFLELGVPLSLLALALVIRERRDRGLPPWLPEWGRLTAAVAILIAGIWTIGSLRTYGYGVVSPPLAMARWMGEHGKPGERVFTLQWADSSPLLYAAPQLQSLVALDPTAFYLKDPKLFQTYVAIAAGQSADPARAIRQEFGARWVTAPYNFYRQAASQIAKSPGVQIVYADQDYAVMDLGPPL